MLLTAEHITFSYRAGRRAPVLRDISLALSSGEVIDLLNYNNLSGQLSTCVRNSWATALDDLVQIWGQGAL